MLRHPEFYLEKLDSAQLETILAGSLELLAKTGLLVQDQKLWAALEERQGDGVTAGVDGRLRLTPEKALTLAALAPATWTHRARRPEHDLILGGRNLAVAPGYGSVFIVDTEGRRREATLADYVRLTRLSQASPLIDLCSGVVVEPSDVPVDRRAEFMTAALLLNADKPVMGAVTGAEGAARCFEAAEIILGPLGREAWLLGLINVNSPLRLDERMAGALRVYLEKGQPVIFTPGASMGITGPATVSGNMAQSYADLIGAVAVTQILRPGHPVIVGNGGFGGNLHTGNPGYGRPENALATVIGAQMARRLALPYRCSAAVTSSMLPDGRAAYEHTVTAMGAWTGGASLALQAAGIIDSINSMSFEQFAVDLEIWGYVERLSRPVTIDDEHLALDLIAEAPSNYLALPHTMRHFRREIHEPMFGKPQKPETARPVNDLAAEALIRLEQKTPEIRPVDPAAAAELKKYLTRGETALAGLTTALFLEGAV